MKKKVKVGKGKKVSVKKIHKDFSNYEEKIDKLRSLGRELRVLDPQGFKVEEKIIRSQLKDPTKIPLLEKRLKTLKRKMLKKPKRKSPIKKIQKGITKLTEEELHK